MRLLPIFHVVTGGALLALAIQTVLNVRHLPRLERMSPPSRFPRVAVLLPARNEAARIGKTVRAWTRQSYPDAGILVYDDASADGTGVLAAAAGGDRVRVLRGGPLPAGWRGKTHASHQLREHTDAEILVFADADVTPAASTLAAAVSALESLGADALSALPRHESPRLGIRALVALQNWAPLAFVPLWAWRLARRPLFTVMNGQFLAIRAAAYDRVGGFAAVRASLGEDVALGRRLAATGHTVALVDGSEVMMCRAYESLAELWSAHVRHLRAAFFGSSALTVAALATLTALLLAPPGLLIAGIVSGRAGTAVWTWLPLAEVTLALLPRALSDARAGYGGWVTSLHPLAIIALFAMAIDAAWRAACGRPVTWRGRRYWLERRA